MRYNYCMRCTFFLRIPLTTSKFRFRTYCQNFDMDYHMVFGKSLKKWNYEVREFGQTSPENLYSDDSIDSRALRKRESNTSNFLDIPDEMLTNDVYSDGLW